MINVCRGDTLSPTFDARLCSDGVYGVASSAASGAASGSSLGPYGAIAGGAIGALGSIASGVIGSNMSYDNQMRMLRYQNGYNTPVNQYGRLVRAGLNPYLMSGAINTGNQVSPGDGAAVANTFASGALAGFQQLGNLAIAASQVRKTTAEAIQQEKQNVVTDTKNQLDIQQAKAALDGQNIINASNKYELDNLKPEQLVKLQKEVENLAADTANKMTQNGVLNLQQDYMVKQIEQLGLSNKQARLLLQYYEPMLQLQLAESKMRVDTGYMNAHSNEVSANAAATNAETNKSQSPYVISGMRASNAINWQKSWEDKMTSQARRGLQNMEYQMQKFNAEMQPVDWFSTKVVPIFGNVMSALWGNNSYNGYKLRKYDAVTRRAAANRPINKITKVVKK